MIVQFLGENVDVHNIVDFSTEIHFVISYKFVVTFL